MFEWDPAKERKNLSKHGVTFHEALTVFGDPFAITYPDLVHSSGEDRYVTFGYAIEGPLLAVVHVEMGSNTRIITARHATPRERRLYEEG